MDIAPQTDIPVGNTNRVASTGNNTATPSWQGLTIKDILENVDLFNFTMLTDEEDEKLKAMKSSLTDTVSDSKKPEKKTMKYQPKSAFLGPQIWKRPITLNQLAGTEEDDVEDRTNIDVSGAQFSVMNVDEFLAENDFDFGNISPSTKSDIYDEESRGGQRNFIPTTIKRSDYRIRDDSSPSESSCEATEFHSMGMETDTSSISAVPQEQLSRWNKRKNDLPKGENNFLYAESKRARLEREREERRHREEARIEFSAEELALATVPGADFDPTERQFSIDELKPQPIIRKRKKSYVTAEKKDDKYWEKRNKNNVAARRSREARRLKENQISLRTAFLEQQNAALMSTVQVASKKQDQLMSDKQTLLQKLKKYERMSPFLNNIVD